MDWPSFTWDIQALAGKLADVRHRQGRLFGRMESLGFDLKSNAILQTITDDVVKSSAIEGEFLDPAQVRSSVARRLGINTGGLVHASRNIEGIVEMMLDATQKYSKPLTMDRLFGWHSAVFPSGRSGMFIIKVGAWRTLESGPMQIVSGPIGHEKVHFEAPSADLMDREMQVFLDWFNNGQKTDPVLKAAIAHFWFVTIHPFEDGNGRIARAIGDMALARAENSPERFYSMSAQIAVERKDYYSQLQKQSQGTPDITGWLDWFVGCLGRAIESAQTTLSNILFKAKLWDWINQDAVNERQRLIINRMLADDFEGHMNTSKYAKMAKCSNGTALRDIQELNKRRILIKNPSGGRSTSYRITDQAE